ncbi:hypothetical protein DB345_05180 [Spartobacteria bacterium LR76]|nr:hypothetical protein DB345_05180 [Spartobacteria bacterium LR76]
MAAPIAKANERVVEYTSPINLSIIMRPIWTGGKVKNTQFCLRYSGTSYPLAATDISRTRH